MRAVRTYLKFIMPALSLLVFLHTLIKPFDLWNWITVIFVISYYIDVLTDRKKTNR